MDEMGGLNALRVYDSAKNADNLICFKRSMGFILYTPKFGKL